MSELIDGKGIARAINRDTAALVETLPAAAKLAIVTPTSDEGAAWYVRALRRAADRLGIACEIEESLDALDGLADASDVHGILCQTPLPDGLTLAEVGARIPVAKDVDGANPTSLGMLAAGVDGAFAPATAAAVLEILRRSSVPLVGRRVVVVGRSTVVGKPAALLLLAEHATVTVCHSRTTDLPAVCRSADVLVAAVGRAGLIDSSYVQPGAVVIDVGTNPTPSGGLVGDVDPAVESVAAAMTPVPGGVGPVTTAMLMRQTVEAAARQLS